MIQLAALLIVAQPMVPQATWFPGSLSIQEVEVIPPAFRGTWATSRAMGKEEDGVERLTIYPTGVDYFESGGRLERVTQAGQERSIKLKLAYEGEGEFWDQVETWTLDERGSVLTMEVPNAGELLKWVRCR